MRQHPYNFNKIKLPSQASEALIPCPCVAYTQAIFIIVFLLTYNMSSYSSSPSLHRNLASADDPDFYGTPVAKDPYCGCINQRYEHYAPLPDHREPAATPDITDQTDEKLPCTEECTNVSPLCSTMTHHPGIHLDTLIVYGILVACLPFTCLR